MIVASFLVKDLLINWQWGENYFMKMLLDGDLAPNNGGWQWAASTGCDPQPYFRIFNPWLQAAKFDPDADYIKTYIPELKNLTAKEIHTPGGREAVKYYPRPIIDHKTQSAKAIAIYKSARS
jgi:deoxyribodipyrimidine photo-lyase